MIQQLRALKLLIPSVMVIVALPVLIGLGFWQLDRLAWKQGLLADIAARATAEPVPLRARLSGPSGEGPVADADLEYARVSAQGRFVHDKELYFYAPDPRQGPGVHVYTPFALSDGGKVVFVNRGYVPEALKQPAARSEGQIADETTVVGLIRRPVAPDRFVPSNEPDQNLWFWRDLPAMRTAAFGTAAAPEVLPIFIEAEGEAPGGWPKGGVTELKLPNRHFEYALTWFGFAAALFAIFLIYASQRIRGGEA